MKTNLKNMMVALETMGVDTTKFVVNLDNVSINIGNDDLDNIVESKYIQNGKIDRRWITAQTFRMLNSPRGWDAFLRENYSYMYQFSMLIEEFKTQSKLEIQKKYKTLEERQKFFDTQVAYQTCKAHIKYVAKEEEKERLLPLVEQMNWAKSPTEMYGLLKAFRKAMYKCPGDTKKSHVWKDAFKGQGAYESLKNMVKYHGVHVHGMYDKEALEFLDLIASKYKGEGWRMHALLKQVIKDNDFNLAESIKANKD